MKSGTNIPASGRVGRGVFTGKEQRKARNGRVPSSVFFDSPASGAISVHRLTSRPGEIPAADSGLASDETMAEIGDRDAAERGAKDGTTRTFYGWGELSVQDAAEDGRKVIASPLPENPWHADIILPAADVGDKARRRHAENLAARAIWRPRPE